MRKGCSPRYASGLHGFTLLELTVVMALIGLVLAGGLVTFTASLQSSQYNSTVAQMGAIDQALTNYSVAFGRIPCPTNLTCTSGQLNYGAEASCTSTTASCTSGTTGVNFLSSSGVAEGGVPTRALRLPDNYQYDAWGNRIRYAVDPTYTTAGTLPIAPVGGGCRLPDGMGITVYDSTGSARTTTAIYALFSHGQNGHGAYGAYPTATPGFNAGSTNTAELANCHCLSNGTANTTTGYLATYWQMLPTLDPTTSTNNFDDIVTFKENWQMQTPAVPLQAKTCLYVVDEANNRLQAFTANNSWVGYLGSSGSHMGQFSSPLSVAVDASGNIWVVDLSNMRVQKFDSSGNWLLALGNAQPPAPPSGCTLSTATSGCSAGTGNGQLDYPSAIAFDLSGNPWISSYMNSQLRNFNASTGAYINNNITTGLSYPKGIAIDASGNFWVANTGANKVVELNPGGTKVLQTIGGKGYANGYFSASDPISLALDSQGNVWVPDYGNNRVQEFSSNGSWIQTIPSTGCANSSYPACAASVATGQFDQPISVAFSPSTGQLWVSDQGNNRLQAFAAGASSSVYVQSIPPAASCTNTSPPACTHSSAKGHFYTPYRLFFSR